MAKSCKEGAATRQARFGSEGCRFITQHQQELFTTLSILPLVICISNINSCVRRIVHATNYICFTFERYDMTAIRKIMVATWQPLKKFNVLFEFLMCKLVVKCSWNNFRAVFWDFKLLARLGQLSTHNCRVWITQVGILPENIISINEA